MWSRTQGRSRAKIVCGCGNDGDATPARRRRSRRTGDTAPRQKSRRTAGYRSSSKKPPDGGYRSSSKKPPDGGIPLLVKKAARRGRYRSSSKKPPDGEYQTGDTAPRQKSRPTRREPCHPAASSPSGGLLLREVASFGRLSLLKGALCVMPQRIESLAPKRDPRTSSQTISPHFFSPSFFLPQLWKNFFTVCAVWRL